MLKKQVSDSFDKKFKTTVLIILHELKEIMNKHLNKIQKMTYKQNENINKDIEVI